MSDQMTISGEEYYKLIETDLNGIKQCVTGIEKELSKINVDNDIANMKICIFNLIQQLEKLAVKGRSIPILREEIKIDGIMHIESKMKVVSHGETLTMEIPLLIPKSKSNKANKNYLVSMFHEEFKNYFRKNGMKRFKEPTVIWFEFQYDRKKGMVRFRDHDDIETKIVKDLLVPYIITDDCPLYCDDFCSSRYGDYDATFIHVIPRKLFPSHMNLLDRMCQYGNIT